RVRVVSQTAGRTALPSNSAPGSWWPAGDCFNSQALITGTNVLDSKYEPIIANPTASDRGTNSARAAPVMTNDGMNTARTHSIARRRGTAVSWIARQTARATESVR